jgi:hypothetical protein
VREAASKVVTATRRAIIHADIDSGHPYANGLTIYFPNGVEDIDLPGVNIYDPLYSSLAFGRDMFWDDFLRDYFAKGPLGWKLASNTPPSCTITNPASSNISIEASVGVYTIEGMAFDVQSSPHVELTIDGVTEVVPVDADGTWSFDWKISEPAGVYTIAVQAVDSAGEKSPVFIRVVNIEGKPEAPAGWQFDEYLLIALCAVVVILFLAYFTYGRVRRT